MDGKAGLCFLMDESALIKTFPPMARSSKGYACTKSVFKVAMLRQTPIAIGDWSVNKVLLQAVSNFGSLCTS